MLLHEIIKRGRDEDTALKYHQRRVSYLELKEAIKRSRNKMYELGIRRGDRVAIFSRNSIEFVYAYFAAASLGAINVPINFQLSNRETAYILKDSDLHIKN